MPAGASTTGGCSCCCVKMASRPEAIVSTGCVRRKAPPCVSVGPAAVAAGDSVREARVSIRRHFEIYNSLRHT
jgi:hypothetical protein